MILYCAHDREFAADILKEFEKKTGIKVNYDNYDNNEILHTKLVAGKTGYDIVVPGAPFAKLQIDGKLLQKLDRSQLKNWSNLDPALLELRGDIALTDARLADLLGRVDSGESGALWARLMQARLDLLAYRRAGDTVKTAEALNVLLDLVGQGHGAFVQCIQLVGPVDGERGNTIRQREQQSGVGHRFLAQG